MYMYIQVFYTQGAKGRLVPAPRDIPAAGAGPPHAAHTTAATPPAARHRAGARRILF